MAFDCIDTLLSKEDCTVGREMEVSSMILCKGYTPWQGLLLTASLLTYWYLPITAQVTIELVPPNVFEGENVRLEVHNMPEDFLAFAWYRGVTNMKRGIAVYAKRKGLNATGPAYSGRQTMYSDGSLLLQRVILKDTGFYTLRVINRQKEIVSTTSVFLHVQISILTCGGRTTSDQPTIEIVPPNVAEGANVLLLAQDLPENLKYFFWYKGVIPFTTYEIARHTIDKNSSFPGPAHSGRETVYSNGSLLLHNVTLDDIGFYTLKTVTREMKLELIHEYLQVNASISTCCNTLSSVQLTIETGSQHVVKGQNIVLLLHNLPEDLLGFAWYKGLYTHQPFRIVTYDRAINSITWGPVSSRREMLHINGSLLLQGITEKDAGLYTILTLNRALRVGTIYVHLHVYKPVTEPFLQVSDSTVTVQSSVVFSCLSTDTRISIRWLFNNQSLQLTERMTLSSTKCGLSIDPVRREDAGYYKCEVSNSFSSETSLPVRLMVTNK
ncbi:pregnancy-specific glycoprotein 22-like [Microtus pennsylvanicus]|uniref:pregnancy-specific glycoprotein 22-like n=1 Tax=Microtus pennsylvanicus TaxID=10058 RepID=UPI003F6CBEF6